MLLDRASESGKNRSWKTCFNRSGIWFRKRGP